MNALENHGHKCPVQCRRVVIYMVLYNIAQANIAPTYQKYYQKHLRKWPWQSAIPILVLME